MAPDRKWTKEELQTDAVSKADLVTFLQTNGSNKFLKQHKVFGQPKNVLKQSKKDDLVVAFEALFVSEDFRTEADEQELQTSASAAKPTEAAGAADASGEGAVKKTTLAATAAKAEEPKYQKTVLKKGDKVNFPKAGDQVAVRYTGKLDNGTVFDTNMDKKSKQPLRFKAGKGIVIRGWDEALLTMSKGEQARIVIESDWAYGKKGKPEAGIPPDARLTFEVELLDIN